MATNTAQPLAEALPGVTAAPVAPDGPVPAAKRTARRLYDAIAGGAQWYGEQWEDLVVEARATTGAGEASLSATGMLTALSTADVESDIPGRLRLRLKQLKGQEQLAHQGARLLTSIEGITQVEISARTGSVLIHYDSATYATRDALLAGCRAASEGN